MSFFQLVKRPDVQKLFTSSFWSFLIVGFLLLFLHVQRNLGRFYAAMTLSIIIFMGIAIYFQQQAMKGMKKGKGASDIIKIGEESIQVVNPAGPVVTATLMPNVFQVRNENVRVVDKAKS